MDAESLRACVRDETLHVAGRRSVRRHALVLVRALRHSGGRAGVGGAAATGSAWARDRTHALPLHGAGSVLPLSRRSVRGLRDHGRDHGLQLPRARPDCSRRRPVAFRRRRPRPALLHRLQGQGNGGAGLGSRCCVVRLTVRPALQPHDREASRVVLARGCRGGDVQHRRAGWILPARRVVQPSSIELEESARLQHHGALQRVEVQLAGPHVAAGELHQLRAVSRRWPGVGEPAADRRLLSSTPSPACSCS